MTATKYVPLESDPTRVRAMRFLRALIVGAAATGTDVTVFIVAHRLLHFVPSTARAPALLAGALVQFFGNRGFTFRARKGSLARHARFFFLFEAGALVANYLIYTRLVQWIRFLPPELVTFIGTFFVFALYSYPIRRLVIFRILYDEARRAAAG